MPKIDHQQLLKFCNQLLSTGGMARDDADLVARLLVRGELRGYPGHGVIRVNPYLNWIKDGTYQIKDKPAVEREGKITAVVDGKHYIGQVAAHFAMELAIKKAKEHGAGIVCLRRAGHTGRLADYMEMAADQGMIGMAAASVGSAVTALYGAMAPITGTNPMAFGIPARGGKQIILDFATASMSMGEIQKRVRNKEKIPEGVMLDGHGNPTTDFKTFRGPPRGVLHRLRRLQGFRHRVDDRNPRRPAVRQRHGRALLGQPRPWRQRTFSSGLRRRRISRFRRLSTTKLTSSSPLLNRRNARRASARFSCPASPAGAEKRRISKKASTSKSRHGKRSQISRGN